jgi:hypothetical protein
VGLLGISGAQAADLPIKTKTAEYVRTPCMVSSIFWAINGHAGYRDDWLTAL